MDGVGEEPNSWRRCAFVIVVVVAAASTGLLLLFVLLWILTVATAKTGLLTSPEFVPIHCQRRDAPEPPQKECESGAHHDGSLGWDQQERPRERQREAERSRESEEGSAYACQFLSTGPTQTKDVWQSEGPPACTSTTRRRYGLIFFFFLVVPRRRRIDDRQTPASHPLDVVCWVMISTDPSPPTIFDSCRAKAKGRDHC